MSPETARSLITIFTRDSRSFIQYVGDADPWTTPDNVTALNTIQEVVESEKEALADISQQLLRARVPMPYPGSYPTAFTSMNFLALEWIAKKMIRTEDELISLLETEIATLEGEEKSLVQALLDLKKSNREKLQQLTATQEPVAQE